MKPPSPLRRIAPLLILLLAVPLLGGCSRFHRQRSPRLPYKKLSPPVAYEIMRDNPEMLVIDLRPPQEYNGETGHIRRARNIPLKRLPYHLLEISAFRDDTILVYCSVGDCAEQGAKLLLASGFESVILMDGGIEKWIRQGFKTVLPAAIAGKQDIDGEQPIKPARPQKTPNSDLEVPVTPPPPER